jgi:hypothetical protein
MSDMTMMYRTVHPKCNPTQFASIKSQKVPRITPKFINPFSTILIAVIQFINP